MVPYLLALAEASSYLALFITSLAFRSYLEGLFANRIVASVASSIFLCTALITTFDFFRHLWTFI